VQKPKMFGRIFPRFLIRGKEVRKGTKRNR
jgi:hypothetical protein